MLLSELHRHHRRDLSAMRRAPGTIRYYQACLNQLEGFMVGEGKTPDLESIDRAVLQDFVIHLRERGLSPGGEAALMRGVRASLLWAWREELVETNPLERFRMAPIPQVRPPAITPDLVRQSLDAAGKLPFPLRNKAMMLTLYDTGLRMGELLALRESDLDMEAGLLLIRAETTKRKKERRVPLGSKASRAISLYERRERKPARHVDLLFLNRSGQRLTPAGLHNVMARAAQKIGINRALTAPHAWRRGFATNYLRGGGDIATLQMLLGHATIDQTRVYLRLEDDDLTRAHMRASPADRL